MSRRWTKDALDIGFGAGSRPPGRAEFAPQASHEIFLPRFACNPLISPVSGKEIEIFGKDFEIPGRRFDARVKLSTSFAKEKEGYLRPSYIRIAQVNNR
jgi:hypothetical protein